MLLITPAVLRPPIITAMARLGGAADANRQQQRRSVVLKPPAESRSLAVDLHKTTKPELRRAPAVAASKSSITDYVGSKDAHDPPPPDADPLSAAAGADGMTTLLQVHDDQADLPISRGDFPQGFMFGAASSSYQVEGAWHEYGKGPSVWDIFAHERPEMISDRSNGDIAIDLYHRYQEDLGYANEANMDAYRFSICWPRILPKGSLEGGINKDGIAHYSKMIDTIVKNGMEPVVTLFHSETPQEIESRYKSLLSQRFVDDYRDFVNICFKEYGDRVKYWITFNEPSLFCKYGYSTGTLPPARCSPWMDGNCLVGDSAIEPYVAGHHLLLAHAAAVQLYKAEYQETQVGKIGMTLTSTWGLPYDKTSKADIDAVSRWLDFNLGWFLDPITQGDYPYTMRATVGHRLPRFTQLQSNLIKGSFDFIGLNYYSTTYVQSVPFVPSVQPQSTSYEADIHVSTISEESDSEEATLDYQEGNYPEGLKSILLYIKDKYNNPTVYITENGFRLPWQPREAAIIDTRRINYHQQHLIKLSEAIKEGANVKGYFVWSLHDSFEWYNGYTVVYGLVYVDRSDLNRYPKNSFTWFKEFLERNVK